MLNVIFVDSNLEVWGGNIVLLVLLICLLVMISGNLSKTMPQNCIKFSSVSRKVSYIITITMERISKSLRISVSVNDILGPVTIIIPRRCYFYRGWYQRRINGKSNSVERFVPITLKMKKMEKKKEKKEKM